MHDFKNKVMESYKEPFPASYMHYIEDSSGTACMPEKNLDNLTSLVRKLNLAISFISHVSATSVNFLDLVVAISP